MDNYIEVSVPSEPRIWSMLAKTLAQNSKNLTNTMEYYRSNNVTFGMEDIAPMLSNCEQILQVANDIYEDILKMETKVTELKVEFSTNSYEEGLRIQGEYELTANKV